MTKAATPTEKSKQLRNNTKTPPKTFKGPNEVARDLLIDHRTP